MRLATEFKAVALKTYTIEAPGASVPRAAGNQDRRFEGGFFPWMATYFTTLNPWPFSKPLNCAGQVLVIQHRNQPGKSVCCIWALRFEMLWPAAWTMETSSC
jgi:hypothetical protein